MDWTMGEGEMRLCIAKHKKASYYVPYLSISMLSSQKNLERFNFSFFSIFDTIFVFLSSILGIEDIRLVIRII